MRIELSTGVYEVVDVPDLSPDYQRLPMEVYTDYQNYPIVQRLQYPSDTYQGYQNFDSVALPEGHYQLIGTTTEIAGDEDKCREIVEKEWGGFFGHIEGYYDYCPKVVMMDGEPLSSAIESFRSLCQKYNVKDNSVWLRKL